MQFTLLEILVGILITEWTFIFVARRIFGKWINRWYSNYGIWAVMSDISSIFIGILIAMFLYRGTSFWTLVGTSVAVQWVHDLLFYMGVIVPLPRGVNGIIDILKPYGADAGIAAVFGDSWMMAGSLLFAKLVSTLPQKGQIFALLVSTYMLPYAIYQKSVVPI